MTQDEEITFRSDVTVELVRASATDADVIFAARVSTAGEQSLEDVDADAERSAGLVNYLMRDRHGSPFEHNSMTFFVRAPIFVWREHMRHRIASYNEESGRYRQLEPVFYVPDRTRPVVQVGKTGAYEFLPGSDEQYDLIESDMRESCRAAYASYQRMLDAGIAREVARMVLPGLDLLQRLRDPQRAIADELPVPATQGRGLALPVLPAAGDRDGGGALRGGVVPADADHPRRLREERQSRPLTGRDSLSPCPVRPLRRARSASC